jgi:[NiFe] hydrogenase diaphorase moiety small subunit
MRLSVDGDGRLGDSQMAAVDRAARACPVACIVIKREGFRVPDGQRRFDKAMIGADIEAKRRRAGS